MTNDVVIAWPPIASSVIAFRKAMNTDCIALFPKLRERDCTELALSSGVSTAAILVQSVELSEDAWLATGADGAPLGLFDVAPHGDLGVVWMVATPEVANHAVELVLQGRAWIKSILPRYSRLFNFVHAENVRSISWLRSLGFTIGELVPEFGAGKAPFYLFYQDPPCVNQ